MQEFFNILLGSGVDITPPTGQTHWYKFDNNFTDSSGNGFTAVGVAPYYSFVTGFDGASLSAIKMDNSGNSDIVIPMAPSDYNANTWSGSFFFKLDSATSDGLMFSKRNNSTELVRIQYTGSTGLWTLTSRSSAGSLKTRTATQNIGTNITHVAVTFDKQNASIKVYVNGSQIINETFNFGTEGFTSNYFYMSGGGLPRMPLVTYDSLRIFNNKVLTYDEVQVLKAEFL